MRARKIRNKHRESRTVAKIEMRDKIKGYRKGKINDEIFKIRTGGILLSQFATHGKTSSICSKKGSKIQTQDHRPEM